MKINTAYRFIVSADAEKRNKARKEIILQERIQCFIRMARNGETDERIALYTTFDLDTVAKMRETLEKLMADAPAQKSMAFQHHGHLFLPRKTSWLSRVKMASRCKRRLCVPNSYERLK